MVSHKVSKLYIIQKTHKKLMGKIPVAGERLNLGVEGLGGSPPGGDKIEVYSGSQPGQESRSVSGGEAHTPFSQGTKGIYEGALLSEVQIRWNRGSP